MQGNGSGAALAIVDAVAKHNERNPGKEVVYLNYAAVDPDLTNSKCNFWHFRLDADTSMKMEAMTTFMKDQPDVKKVYLLNQNYSHGQQVAALPRRTSRASVPTCRSWAKTCTRLAQVQDFAPYVAKIKASGADTIITGNWGADLTLLIKAANDGGLTTASSTPTTLASPARPPRMGARRQGRVFQISLRPRQPRWRAWARWHGEFKKKFNDDYYTCSTIHMLRTCSARPWPRPSRPTR